MGFTLEGGREAAATGAVAGAGVEATGGEEVVVAVEGAGATAGALIGNEFFSFS